MKIFTRVFLTLFLTVSYGIAEAEQKNVLLKPYTLAKVYKTANKADITGAVKDKLSAAGYQLLGTYNPFGQATIFIITDKGLIKAASKTRYGGFGAAIRVAVSQVGSDVQVSHTNPTYMSLAYRMKADLSAVRNKLAKVLGYSRDFGGKGVPSNDLAEYRYSAWLENFLGFMELAEHKSHKQALAKIAAGFKKMNKSMQQVYRVDIPGKNQVVFGVALNADVKKAEMLNDKHVMGIIDHKEFSRNAHLPYEVMVDGNRIFALHPHFRIAVNFPDMHMFGKNSFGKLLNLPYTYEEHFIQLAGGVWPRPDEID